MRKLMQAFYHLPEANNYHIAEPRADPRSPDAYASVGLVHYICSENLNWDKYLPLTMLTKEIFWNIASVSPCRVKEKNEEDAHVESPDSNCIW